jgi:small subunit ribosomal protein S8
MVSIDPVSNLVVAIKNANMVGHEVVNVPYSKFSENIVKVLLKEGYIKNYQVIEVREKVKELRIYLKYGPNGEKVINNIKRISTTGRRIYTSYKQIPKVCDGLGTCVLTTPKGVLSDKDAKKLKAGGEILFYIW